MVASLSACVSNTRTASTVPSSGNLARLMAMPDAEQARTKAPIFTRAALQTVNELETSLKEEKVK